MVTGQVISTTAAMFSEESCVRCAKGFPWAAVGYYFCRESALKPERLALFSVREPLAR